MREEATLEFTPTWVVAIVCLVIVSISLAAERFLHYLGKYLKHKEQKALFSALQRLKEELMLLGFISFILSLSQGFIVSICIPETSTDFMLPCKRGNPRVAEGAKICKKKCKVVLRKNVFKNEHGESNRPALFQGDVPLLSLEALHQLHIFIFVLGLVHVVFCAATMLLGGAKMRRWKHWETEIHREIQEKLQQAKNEGQETPLSIVVLHWDHQDEFVRERTKGFWMKLAVVSWITAFLKQFHDSVSKSDYEALRSAFVVIHYPKKPDFDFHTYMIRAVEHEFKRVVGISWYLWLFVIFFLLLNINGWHTYFWLAFLPLFLLLIVGAKLEHIITRLAQDAAKSLSNGREEVPKIKPSKDHFWFHKPELVLHLIHFILFQNSFEIGFFFWVLVSEGFGSCMMERKHYAISRLVIGIVGALSVCVLTGALTGSIANNQVVASLLTVNCLVFSRVIIEVICSYITLPLYAIVTHMTGEIKLHGLGSGVHESVHGWLAVRKKPWKRTGGDPGIDSGGEDEATRGSPKERSGTSSRNMLTVPAPPFLDEIVTVDDDVAVAATAVVGQGP